MELNYKKILIVLLLVLVMVISVLPVANYFSNQATYQKTIDSIEDKMDTVMKLTATSTIASGAISMLPDDTATPIAAELAEFSEYFLLILCALYAEKYLLTIIGVGVFRILIPCICVLLIAGILGTNRAANRLAIRIGAIGLAVFLVIPMSTHVADLVYDGYRNSINETISVSESFSNDPSQTVKPEGNSSLWDKLSGTAVSVSGKAANIMNGFVESLAIMIVTACIIPIIVLLFFFWLIRVLTGVEVVPSHHLFRKEHKVTEPV